MPHQKGTRRVRDCHQRGFAAGKYRQTSSSRVFAKWTPSASYSGPALTASAFCDHFPGYPLGMSERDEIPIADAIEQQQETSAPAPDEEASVTPPADVPLEASGADWQEQLEEVDDDPEERAND